MVLFISVVRLSRKKIQFVLTSCEFGSVSKYSSVILETSFLSLHQSADFVRWFPVSNRVEVYFKCNCFVITHARCGVCIGDDGGV